MEAKLAQLPGFILLQNSLILKEIFSKEIFSLVHIIMIIIIILSYHLDISGYKVLYILFST